MLNRAMTNKPNDPAAFFALGLTHQAEGKLEDAVANYRQAIALKPDYVEAHNNLGVSLKNQGKLDQAVASYQRALALDPDYAEAHYNLANALLAQGRFAEALASYDRAIALRPHDVKAFNNRGVAFRELKLFDEAVSSCQRAIALNPDYADAHNNLGVMLKNQGKFADAEASYQRAIALKPDYAEAYNNLGVVLWDRGKLADAMASYDQALAIKPNHADALKNRCTVLIELGRLAEAQQTAERAIQLLPRNAASYRALGMVRRYSNGDPYVTAMQVLLDDARSLAINDRIELHFALAKAYEDLGQYESAFDQALAGNALKRRQVLYDEARELAELDRVRQAFTSELFFPRSNVGEPSQLPIFIVGMPRSGSTLVEQILASHPKVFAAGELKCLDKAIANMTRNASQVSAELLTNLSDEQFRQLAASYFAEIRQLAPQAQRIVDKMLSNYIRLGLIHIALPNAAIIHTVRDPLDTCISCFFSLFTEGHRYSYDLAELGRYFRHYQALMANWHRVLPPGRILDVHYEDVVCNLEDAARRVVSHCGLDWDSRCLTFYKTERPVRTASAAQVRQPIYENAIGRGRKYQAWLSPLLAELEGNWSVQ